MYELTKWINRNLKEISKEKLFIEYFSDHSLEDIEGYCYLTNTMKGIDLAFSDNLSVNAIPRAGARVPRVQ